MELTDEELRKRYEESVRKHLPLCNVQLKDCSSNLPTHNNSEIDDYDEEE